MADHPRMLYRKGNERSLTLHGVQVDTLIVEDAEEEAAAVKQGWRRTPVEAHASKNGNGNEEKRLREELAIAKAEIAKVDHDGDGRIGGSRPKLGIKTEKDKGND